VNSLQKVESVVKIDVRWLVESGRGAEKRELSLRFAEQRKLELIIKTLIALNAVDKSQNPMSQYLLTYTYYHFVEQSGICNVVGSYSV
jgi:hypothetical protein